MADLVTELRRAVLVALKADNGWTALVPAASTYGQQAPANPSRPFAKLGTPIASPMEGACFSGERIRVTVYILAGPRLNGSGQTIETAEDHLGRIVAKAKDVLHRGFLPITGGHAKLRFVNDIRRQVDGEADLFECNLEFIAKLMALPA